MAVNNVIIPLIKNATITALPASPIAGPTRTKIDPPIMPAIPIITTSARPNVRTR
jgi:hypothetical protein